MGVQVIEFYGGLVAEAVFQTHFGKVVAFEVEADVLVAGVGAFGRGQDVVSRRSDTCIRQKPAISKAVRFENLTY